MAVVQYTVTRTIRETRQLIIDDTEFTAEHGHTPAEAEEHQLSQHLLESGKLERGEVVADQLAEFTGPEDVFVLDASQDATDVEWRVAGFWNDEKIVIVDVACAQRTLDRADDVPSVTNHCGPWSDTVEVPLNATDEQVWVAARELADEYEN